MTTDPTPDASPVWTPDGRRLIFTSQAGGVPGSLFSQAADGSGIAERLTDGTLIQRATAFLPRGQGLVFLESGVLKVLTLGPPRAIETLVPFAGDAVVSPDGRWLAYTGLDSGVPHVYVSAQASPGTGRTQVTPVGGTQPRWAPGGRELYYIGLDGMLMAVPINAVGPFAPGPPTRVLDRAYFSGLGVLARVGSYDVAPDGRFLMLKPVATPGTSSELPTVVVVKNWAEELKRRIPPPTR